MPAPISSRLAVTLLFFAVVTLAAGCARLPEAPILAQRGGSATLHTAARLDAVLPADVLLLGEQHDAAAHQRIEQEVVSELASRGLLAALALEMADAGVSTAALQPSATEAQTRRALQWNDESWPWAAYGPAVMTAVRAGVPVLGANLPRTQMRSSMADSLLDAQLPGPALKAQQQLIRIGHCHLLPESQITSMTRIQIARDITMARTLAQAALPGKVVVLLAGNGHVNRALGVPKHLPASLKAKAIGLQAGRAGEASGPGGVFDATWETPALPDTDYCASLREQMAPKGSPAATQKP